MSARLPTGTVTFLFTDIEGSTRLLHELGPEAYAGALLEHRRLVRAAVAAHDGVEVDTQGDAFFVAFPTAPAAVRAAARIIDDLAAGPIRLRMGVHTGSPFVTDEGYVGVDVHRAARIAACGHGGQVLLSAASAALLAPDGLPGVPPLRDLGEHRLKDLSAAERIHQLGDHHFPPLKSLHRTNLPVPATPFLGRDAELAEVLDLLRRDEVRLLTLTGPGGTGKTRLGLQAVAALSDRYPGGVYWVPLAPVRDPALVLGEAAHVLGLTDDLAGHVGDRSVLMLLDNVEQVIEVAPELAGLLAQCPNLRLVVTSRETLRVPGEQVYPVPPLEVDEAVELFAARARTVDPGFEVSPAVGALCARLDRLPLALELAAARTRVLTVDQLLDRIGQRLDLLQAGRGADPRQQTLRATITWSHDLLEPEEQELFARLAVFRGGCRLEAAEQVCGADLDVLQALVDKSLLRTRDGGRFWMLETIREYATERLEEAAEAPSLRAWHAEHFLAMAEQAAPHLRSGRPGPWPDRLEADLDNLRATLEWFDGQGCTHDYLRLAASLVDLWQSRGFLSEGRHVLADGLRAADVDPSLRARALDGAAVLAVAAGDPAARELASEALGIHDRLGEDAGRAESLWVLGYAAVSNEDWATAQAALTESTDIFRRVDDVASLLGASRTLAWIHDQRGDVDTARELHEATLELARTTGHTLQQASVLGSLASIAITQGRLGEAVAMLREHQDLVESFGDRTGVVVNLARIARLLALLGEVETAAVLVACSDEASRTMGGLEAWAVETNEQTRRAAAAALDAARTTAAGERGARLTPVQCAGLGLALAHARTHHVAPDA
ncbi:MAG: adenylate/guanylate cyclase domain-containing protein [Sporichthyaceae bacterium]